MFSSILAVFVAILIGFLIIMLLWPEQKSIFSNFLLKFSLAIGLGFGVSSCLFFIWRLFNLDFGKFILVEIFVIVALILLRYKLKKQDYYRELEELSIYNPKAESESFLQKIFSVGFLMIFFMAIILFIQFSIKFPHGERDAFAIWNVHARFLFRGGEHWIDCLTNNIVWFHPDYPLLLPGIIARCWNYIGHEAVIVQILISFFFTFAIVGLLFSFISISKSKIQGGLAAWFLLSLPMFIGFGSSQCADVPLGFFILATIILFSFQDKLDKNNYNLLILVGMMAGLAAWTKNEGLLFLFSIFIARFITVFLAKGWKTCLKQLSWFTIGLLPVLLIIIYFKTQLAPPNDIFLYQKLDQIIVKLTDFSRYSITLNAFIESLCFMGGFIAPVLLLIYPLLMGIEINTENKLSIITTSVTLFLMLTGYFFIYIITPYDINWHIQSSISRLFIQLCPTLTFLYFMLIRTPEEALTKIKRR